MWQLAKVVSSSEEENTPEPEKVVTDDGSNLRPPVEKETESGKEDAKPDSQNEELTFSGSDSSTKKIVRKLKKLR